jgi:hypothetical protein
MLTSDQLPSDQRGRCRNLRPCTRGDSTHARANPGNLAWPDRRGRDRGGGDIPCSYGSYHHVPGHLVMIGDGREEVGRSLGCDQGEISFRPSLPAC